MHIYVDNDTALWDTSFVGAMVPTAKREKERTKMRKIELEMVHNITSGQNWSKANTAITRAEHEYESIMGVYLHGNHIATIIGAAHGRDEWLVDVNTRTLRTFPTRTTMSRLRALGVDVHTHKGEVLLDGEAI